MHGLKSAILATLSEISWLAGLAIPVSATLQNRQQDFFLFYILIFIYFSKYETIETHARTFLTPNIFSRGRVKNIEFDKYHENLH